MNLELENKIRRWFAAGGGVITGLELLKKLGVEPISIFRLKEKGKTDPKDTSHLLSKILSSIDPYSLELNFDFSELNREFNSVQPSPPKIAADTLTNQPNIPVTTPMPKPKPKSKPDNHALLSDVLKRIEEDSSPKEKEEPEYIKELRKKAVKLHKQQAYLHFELGIAKTDKQRADIAYQIMDEVIPQIDKIYDNIRYWQKTGDLPVIPENNNFKKGVDTVLKRESLRTRIAKLNRLLKKKMPEKKKQQYKKELLDKEAKLQEINELLNMV